MQIIKTSGYNRDYKKKLIDKHNDKEIRKLENIETFLISMNNLQTVMQSPLSKVYGIEKKKGDLKEYYTAHLNGNIRLIMKPFGKYPYNNISIIEIEFIEINNKHYKEG